MALYDLTFKENFKILVAGPSACGKTVSVFKFVTNLPLYARKKIDVIIYVYKIYQSKFDEMVGVIDHFIQDEVDVFNKIKSITGGRPALIIFDDLIGSPRLPEIADFFMVDARHSNMSMMFLSQRLFVNDESFRQLSRNSDYIWLFKNPRDASEIGRLAQQLTPGNRSLIKVYNNATESPWSFLSINLTQDCPKEIKYTSNYFENDGFLHAFTLG